MAHDTQSADAPTSEREFQSHLVGLIADAHANGVDVTGGWDSRPESRDGPHWGVEIYEVVADADR